MSYRNAIEFLESKTKVLELCNNLGARVAVCPEWNGRVMTSSADGLDGDSFGLIHVAGIEKGHQESGYDFFGGEDQFSLAPEGGPFSLFYEVPPEIPLIQTQPLHRTFGFHEGPFEIDQAPPDPQIRLRRNMKMRNLVGATFDLDIIRTARLTNREDLEDLFGETLANTLDQRDLSYVSYQTTTSLINRNGPFSKNTGLVSIRIRGMFNSTSNHVVLLPFKSGDEANAEPTVDIDYFGMAPHGHLRLLSRMLLLRADGKYRCRIGVSRKRVMACFGAVDFRSGVLTLIHFSLPPNPIEYYYNNNDLRLPSDLDSRDFAKVREYFLTETLRPKENRNDHPQPDFLESAYNGNVLRVFTNGPSDGFFCPYYKFDVFSPASELQKNEHLTHTQHTLHINADRATLELFLHSLFQADFDWVAQTMLT